MTVRSPPALDAYEPEAATRPCGTARWLARALSIGLAVYGLYWVVAILDAHLYRTSFLLLALAATFLLYPARRTAARRPAVARSTGRWWRCRASRSAGRSSTAPPFRIAPPPRPRWTSLLGTAAILLVLEATRRTAGWILAATAALFIVYAYVGPLLDLVGLSAIGHRGYYPDRLVGTLYMTLDGIFGVPLEVAATYIVLFTVYGAVLEHSGAGRFFIDWSLAAMGRSRSAAAPGRSVTIAGFLLGTVSGSGVATTVTLGSLAWPILRRAGYSAETSGAIFAAAGIGAVLSPPTLGAAAFLLAEFLEISYLQVLVAATVPMLLYYLSAFLMIEADSRRAGHPGGRAGDAAPARAHPPLRLSLPVPDRDRGADGGGHDGVPRRVVGDRARRRPELHPSRDRAAARGGWPARWRPEGAGCCRSRPRRRRRGSSSASSRSPASG